MMKQWMQLLVILFGVGLFLPGCATIRGMGKDIETAGGWIHRNVSKDKPSHDDTGKQVAQSRETDRDIKTGGSFSVTAVDFRETENVESDNQ